MKKQILLTGATGTVGKEALKQLCSQADYEISVMCRASSKNKKTLQPYLNQIKLIHIDLSDHKEMEKLEGEFDAAIHLAAVIPPLADEQPELTHNVNFTGTKNLIERLEIISPDCFFMFSSSIAVYGDRLLTPDISVSDALPDHEEDAYAQSKLDTEPAIMSSKLDWTIFRLTAIMGVKNHKMTGLMFHMPLPTPMEICMPEDTARAFTNGIEKKAELKNKVFNLAGGPSCRTTYEEFLGINFRINGLGAVDFPPKTFAEKNFHCGNYIDGDDLENITHFRKHTLEDYTRLNEEAVSGIQKFFASLLKRPIKYFMRRQSLPLKAFKNKDKELMERFFN
ncbi:NAD(P)-dependent oxidoreductase [Crocinitomicaceae bacterium]|nr:NAD(P)-dependent oxidoreductase [Crocinitomicaceae bacterium]